MGLLYVFLCSKCKKKSSFTGMVLKNYDCARCHGNNTLSLTNETKEG